MTELQVDALERIAAKKPPKSRKPDWKPLDLADLRPGTYLAADPSVSAFGLVLFEVTEKQRAVHMAETFRTEAQDGLTGWEDLLVRVGMIEGAISEWIARWIGHYPGVESVHEMPPMGGGRLSNPEVALLTSYAFRNACGRMKRLKMVPRQRHANMMCGNSNAKKPVYHKILREQYLPEILGSEVITNEATRDALCVALYASLTRS